MSEPRQINWSARVAVAWLVIAVIVIVFGIGYTLGEVAGIKWAHCALSVDKTWEDCHNP